MCLNEECTLNDPDSDIYDYIGRTKLSFGRSYHHCANFIWRHWTYKMPVRYNLSSVWVRLSIFSQLSIIQYVGLCVFNLPISFVMIARIYILCLIIIIKSEVWTITHCLGLGHETKVCAVCLSIFLCILHSLGHLRISDSLSVGTRNIATKIGVREMWFEIQRVPSFGRS